MVVEYTAPPHVSPKHLLGVSDKVFLAVAVSAGLKERAEGVTIQQQTQNLTSS